MKLAVAQIDSATTSDVMVSVWLHVAVERLVDRSANDDRDEPTMRALVNPEGPGLRLGVADAGDNALIGRRTADPVDDDVVALVLKQADRLIGIVLLSGFRRCEPCWREHDARRRYRCCHTPACAHDSLHSVVCLAIV